MLGFYKAENEHYPLMLGFFKAENEHYPLMLGYKGEKVFENPSGDISGIKEKLYLSMYSKN